MKKYILAKLLFCLVFFHPVYSKETKINRIDRTLSDIYKQLDTIDYKIRYDSLAPLFKSAFINELHNPVTFNGSLDSLSKYIKIVSSTDRMVKFYSWDDYTGGTWHNINSLAQFESRSGKIIVQQLNNTDMTVEEDFTDCSIYRVNDFYSDHIHCYMVFGWGTHGHGSQFCTVMVFGLINDQLVMNKDLFESGDLLVIEYPRASDLKLTYNPESNEISYYEFINNNSGSEKETGYKTTLFWRDGLFRTK